MSEGKAVTIAPVEEQSEVLAEIFRHINFYCFDDKLDERQVMLTFARSKNIVAGHFSPNKWGLDDGTEDSEKVVTIHEIALNANNMKRMSITRMLKTIAHEMCHMHQHEHGKPSRQGYHNEEFCSTLKSIGILPVHPGTENEASSGQSISSGPVIEGSTFEEAVNDLPEDLIFPWTADPLGDDEDNGGGGQGEGQGQEKEQQKQRKSGKRSKYTCSVCGLNVWAKGGVKVKCFETNDCTDAGFMIEQA